MTLAAAPGARGWRLVPRLLLFAAALLLVGQLVPRAIARRWATRLAPLLLPALRALSLVLDPVVRAGQLAARPFRAARAARDDESPRGEIEELLREGELEGIGEPAEIEIISGVVQLGERTLGDVMTPRTAVFALDEATPPREMAEAIALAGYSRVPVYRGSLDEVVGMVHVFDVLKSVGRDEPPPIRQVAYAPATQRCSEMLYEMLRGQRHLAVVLDEFGGTAGIVTLEDVLEELVGDIRDEHDEPADAAAAPAAPVGAAVFDASCALGEAADRVGVTLPARAEFQRQSIGGTLARAVGRIPTVGERFRVGELELTVVEAERTRVGRVLAQRADAAAPVELPADPAAPS